ADALHIFRQIGEQAGIGWILSVLAGESYWAGDRELAASQAAEALEIGTASEGLQVLVVGESRRMLALLAADRGQHAESKRLIEQAVQAFEHAGDRYQVGSMLTTVAVLACRRGEVEPALSPLREALHLAREMGSSERMIHSLEAAVQVL